MTILYGKSESSSERLHVTTNLAHHNLRISADAGTFDGSISCANSTSRATS